MGGYIEDGFLIGCATELFPDLNFGGFLTKLANVKLSGISLKTDVLLNQLKKYEKSKTLNLSIDGCCKHACLMAKNLCLCEKDAFDALIEIAGEDVQKLLKQFTTTCMADNKGIDFTVTLFGTDTCANSFKKVLKGFKCIA